MLVQWGGATDGLSTSAEVLLPVVWVRLTSVGNRLSIRVCLIRRCTLTSPWWSVS